MGASDRSRWQKAHPIANPSGESYGDEAADPRQGEKATISHRVRLMTLHLWSQKRKPASLGGFPAVVSTPRSIQAPPARLKRATYGLKELPLGTTPIRRFRPTDYALGAPPKQSPYAVSELDNRISGLMGSVRSCQG
jgi:hypothetical protein